jgi:hypothetical protein
MNVTVIIIRQVGNSLGIAHDEDRDEKSLTDLTTYLPPNWEDGVDPMRYGRYYFLCILCIYPVYKAFWMTTKLQSQF